MSAGSTTRPTPSWPFPNRHVAFASGFHRCQGSHLARLELRVALEEWHKRILEYSVDDAQIQMVNYGVRTSCWTADGRHAQLSDPARHRRRMFHLPLQIDPAGS
ncbi:possible cytochrome P450, C-terminal (plasmid) [Rhodococcus jostii RHA1]|uniref:Possible cytochrome P450, C-terminal n=1 Tax=Rhodococcus jostii (strain RHA1) TaxID=101510 RepID=Q0RW43_RHOJR|nr:cytochrome P453 [Rhodococcus jostii]ABH00493.1 possible cytochrome P450, C-terminal [Rhodococcus jostii RHA1]